MKKTLSILLAGVLMLSLVACNQAGEQPSSSEGSPSSSEAQASTPEGPVAYKSLEISFSGIEEAFTLGQDFMLAVTVKNTGSESIFYQLGDNEIIGIKDSLLLSDSLILKRNLGSAPTDVYEVAEIPAGGEATLSLYLLFDGEPEFGDASTLETSVSITFYYAMEAEGLTPEAWGGVEQLYTEFKITIDEDKEV